MDVARYLVEAHLGEGRSIADLARVHGVHRSWLYKLLRRYRAEGDAGLLVRSCSSSLTAISGPSMPTASCYGSWSSTPARDYQRQSA